MDCNVIRDLLPLYTDDLLSLESRRLLEEHCKTCPDCRRLLDQLRIPLEPEPEERDRQYQAALIAQQKENRKRKIRSWILGILTAILGVWLFLELIHFRDLFVVVSNDEEAILAEFPDIALTEAEVALADTILEVSDFRSAMSDDFTDSIYLNPDAYQDILASVLPEGAVIENLYVYGCAVSIHYLVGDVRTMLEYYDHDMTGHIDSVFKMIYGGESMKATYTVCHAPNTYLYRYERVHTRHHWFSFLDR